MTRFISCVVTLIFAAHFSGRAGDMDSMLVEGGVLRVRVNHVTGNFPDQFRAATTTNFSSIILDLRFTDGNTAAAGAATGVFSPGKFPLVILVNRQTRGAAGQLAAQLQSTGTGIVIGGTNGTLSPDVTLAVNPAQEKAFQDNPYFTATTQQTGTVSGTNALLSLVDHMSEAELVSKRIKDGEGEYNPAPARRAEPAAPVIRDPALARAVDLLKAVAALHPARG